MRFFVYGLFDPLKPEEIRYVGAAAHERRPLAHTKEAGKHPERKTYKLNWIRSVRQVNWRVLRECNSWDETMAAERATITSLRTAGARLTNATGGGDGFFNVTEEFRQRHSAANARSDVKAKIGAANKRAWAADPERHVKQAEVMRAALWPYQEQRRMKAASDRQQKVIAKYSPEAARRRSEIARRRWRLLNEKDPGHARRMSQRAHVLHPTLGAQNGAKNLHVRWHEKRGLMNPRCCFCIALRGLSPSEKTKRKHKEYWAEPGRKEIFGEAVRASWRTAKEQRRAAMRAAWAVPETRERRRAAIAVGTREYWKQKRASR